MCAAPLFARLYGLAVAPQLGALRAARSAPQETLAQHQAAALRALLADAATNVPFYRRQLREHGLVDAAGTVHLERFASLPPMTKQDLRAHKAELVSETAGRDARWNASGGSTGEPVRILQDDAHRNASRAGKVMFDAWSGYAYGRRRVVLWGSPRDQRSGQHWWRPALRRLKNEIWLDAYRMGADDLDRYAETIRRFRPVNVLGYAESLHELARHLLARAETLPSCAGIVATAGTLYDDARFDIERALGGPVFNRYGSRETGEMAAECAAHAGLHLSPLTHILEVLRPDGSPCSPGERGELVVTPLSNRAMPLLRYRIGDEAALASGECSCGCTWPRLTTIFGRTTDHLLSAREGRIHGGAFRFILNEVDWIRTYQIVQEHDCQLRVLLVPIKAQDAAMLLARDEPMLRARMAELMGDDVAVTLDLREEIPPSPSGKHRHVVSHVGTPRELEARTPAP